MTLGQAIRNAAEVERAAARFYRMLAERASEPRARAFFEKFAEDEVAHAEALEQEGRQLGSDFDTHLPEACLRVVETTPGWEAEETIDAEQAFQIALEAEIHAALYYDTMADYTTGEVAGFFAGLARTEEEHAEQLRQHREELLG
jgi:rubrerythrin